MRTTKRSRRRDRHKNSERQAINLLNEHLSYLTYIVPRLVEYSPEQRKLLSYVEQPVFFNDDEDISEWLKPQTYPLDNFSD